MMESMIFRGEDSLFRSMSDVNGRRHGIAFSMHGGPSCVLPDFRCCGPAPRVVVVGAGALGRELGLGGPRDRVVTLLRRATRQPAVPLAPPGEDTVRGQLPTSREDTPHRTSDLPASRTMRDGLLLSRLPGL